MKISDEREKQKTKTDRNNVVTQAIVKVEELNYFVKRLS